MNRSVAFGDGDDRSNDPVFERTVALNRRLLVTTLIAALLFLWPLLAYGRAGDFQDSAAYYKGGHAAVSFATDKIDLGFMKTSAARSAKEVGPTTQDPKDVRGARSVAYSVAAYVLGAPRPQMWALVAAQALAAGFISAVALLLFGGSIGRTSAKLAVMAVATPVAFVACVIVPDIFAGIIILAITLLAVAYHSLSKGVRIVTILLAAAGIAFHMSHLPLGFGMTILGGAWLFVLHRRGTQIEAGQWACLLSPFLIAAATTIALNMVAFGGASLTGKRFPLTLARSVAEGPGKRYLDRNCGHLKYAICEVYPNGVPDTVNSFLWGKDGVKERATSDQLDRIRAEESEVVFAAARAYPLQEIGRFAIQFGRQLILFQPGVGLDARIVLDANGNLVSKPTAYNPLLAHLVGKFSIIGVIAALALLLRFRQALGRIRPMLALVAGGILMNAAVCVYFSGVTDRYQARVIWLIPLLALMALGDGWPARRRKPSRVASKTAA